MVEEFVRLDKSADMTNRTARKLYIKKILIPPGSKTVTVQLLKKIRPPPETETAEAN